MSKQTENGKNILTLWPSVALFAVMIAEGSNATKPTTKGQRVNDSKSNKTAMTALYLDPLPK